MNLTKLKANVRRAEAALEKAKEALSAAEQRNLIKGLGSEFPIGCKVVSIATKRKGVIQVYKAGDEFQGAIMTVDIPSPGDVVVREVRKDGRPGRRVWSWRNWGYMWKKAK